MISALAGCGTVDLPAKATDAELNIAVGDYKACVWDAIQRLDDKVSDAYTIANAASTTCVKEYNAMNLKFTQDLNEAATKAFMRNVEAKRVDTVVPLVLEHRKQN